MQLLGSVVWINKKDRIPYLDIHHSTFEIHYSKPLERKNKKSELKDYLFANTAILKGLTGPRAVVSSISAGLSPNASAMICVTSRWQVCP
jgi:hypothetical protein